MIELLYANGDVNGQFAFDVTARDTEADKVVFRQRINLRDPRERTAYAQKCSQAIHGDGALCVMINGQLQRKIDSIAPGPVLVKFSEIESLPVTWIWDRRIPLGCITLFVGAPGGGKGHVTVDMAARISTGTPFPDGSPCERGGVVLISGEDDPRRVVKPRLDAAHADCDNVTALMSIRHLASDGTNRDLQFSLEDVDALKSTLDRTPNCRMVIIDPIGSYIGVRTDSYRDNEVRAVLCPIAAIAEQYGVAMVVVAHRRKGTAGSADEAAMGSRAFSGIARSVWHFSRDPRNRDRRFMLSGKNNLAREPDGLAFSLIGDPYAAVVWERDPLILTADEQLAAERDEEKSHRGPAAEAREQAEEWLRTILANGPLPTAKIQEEAKAAGMSFSGAVRRARESIGIVPYQEQFGKAWLWKLPENTPAYPDPLEHVP